MKFALAYRVLTPLYDPIVRAAVREERFRMRLVEQSRIGGGMRVLDLGCGSGALALLAGELHPDAKIVGIDADPEILARARRKQGLGRAPGTRFELASAIELPFPAASFERILSSLMFHHLKRDEKRSALREALRVLAPGGELHVVDWGRPHGPGMRALFLLVQLLDGFEATRDSVTGALVDLVAEAGFEEVAERGSLRTVFGSLAFYSARHP